MIELEIFQDLSSKFFYTKQIENKVLTFNFDYNSRSENWYFSISCLADNTKINNKKVIVNYPILNQNKALFYSIEGDFIVKKTSNTNESLNYDNFGIDYKFYYITKDEYLEWRSLYGV